MRTTTQHTGNSAIPCAQRCPASWYAQFDVSTDMIVVRIVGLAGFASESQFNACSFSSGYRDLRFCPGWLSWEIQRWCPPPFSCNQSSNESEAVQPMRLSAADLDQTTA